MKTKEEYIRSMHRLGRKQTILVIILMLALPTIIAFYFKTFPDIGQVMTASIGLLAIFVPIAISEMISFTPILGSSIYLTLITGNVTNLKLPAVTNAFNTLNIEPGTEEADVISAIVVSISSITTLVIVAIGVFAMVPLRPILTRPAVVTATSYVLPALFGCLMLGILGPNIGGGVTTKKRLLGAVPAALIVIVLSLISPEIVTNLQGFLILFMLPITYFTSKYLFKKGTIKVILPSEKEAEHLS